MGQLIKQLQVETMTTPIPNQQFERVALFDADGAAVVLPTNVTGDDVPLTGYEIAVGADDLEATDTLNEGLGKLEYRVAALETSETGEVDTAAEVRATVLTGLSTADATAVTDADSILVAIGKLQAQISAL